MNYQDEEYLKMKQQMKRDEQAKHEEDAVMKETEEQITDGMVHIYGEEVEFERKTLEEYGLSIILPKDYELLDKETRAFLYPQGNCPPYVYACQTVQGSVAINLTPSIVPNEHMREFVPKMKRVMEQMGPQTKILSCKTIEKEERNVGILEFLSHAIDTNVHNFMTYHSVNNRLLMLTISFPNKNSDRYVALAKQMIDSIIIEEGEE